ncbi:MAG TPA: AAA family ATPase, partial [Acidimicrobiales bacterium]|nr:AAA family ATPase [Acidimicrobiales bacterium]
MSGLIGQLAGENGVSNGHGSARPIMFGSGSYVLIGRRSERALLDRLVEAVRRGESRALVVHGEPGVGKTALLDYLARQASGCRVARIAGIQSEMELAFAGLHQLCGPMLDHLERLPAPQRDALQTILGLATGSPPDRLLVGLAVLSLLSEVAEGQPLICLVDDQQWLDHASAQALAFAARRLVAESVGLVFACRPLSSELAGVPELLVEGLGEADARALLDSALAAPLDSRVRDQIVAETGGNPLALLELPRSATPSQLAGGFGLPVAAPLAGSIEESFCRRLGALADDTRRLLLLAAAEPIGDPAPIWRAAACLGIPAGAAEGAVDAGLAEFGARVRFSHPLVRSAVYRSASALDKHQVHRALADATDADVDPDRRAWHLAQATTGPDEEVAAELERSAGRAQARGGISAGAAFLERAATLTLDPRLRVGRATSAAQAKIQTGAFDAAVDLLAIAEAGPLSHLQRAGLDLARAQLAYATNRGSDAAPLLKRAASGLEPIDVALSRSTYLDALTAAIFAGRLARSGGDVLVVAQAAGAAPAPITAPRAPDFLLDGLAMTYNEGFAAGLPKLRQALAAFAAAMSAEEVLRWSFIACVAAMRTWSDESWESLSARHLQVAREAGALSELPLALISRAHMVLFAGDLGVAASLTDETLALEEATGSKLAPYSALAVAAWRGEEARARAL